MKKMRKRLLPLLLTLSLCLSLCVSAASAADGQDFTDVSPGAWYYDSVQYLAENNLMVGTGDKIFEPNANLTRGMFVTILGRMAGINAAEYTASVFTDVKVGAWYTPYVSWAASKGIVSGYGDSYFGVDDSITREQMATIIARYLSAAGITLSPSDDAVSSFHDAASVSSWAVEGLELMRQTAIIVGDDQGNFNPANTATRAQAATIFMRLTQAIENQKEPEPTPSNPNQDIQIETSYGTMSYPYGFEEILTYERKDTTDVERYVFYAVLDGKQIEVYTISFSAKERSDCGTQLGVVKDSTSAEIQAYLLIEDIDTDGLSQDDKSTVYAAQETLNDVVASLDGILENPEPSVSPVPSETTSPSPEPSESTVPTETPAETTSPSPTPSESPVPSESPTPSEPNQDICVETSYGDLYYPYGFGDVMTCKRQPSESYENYEFYAVLDGENLKAYTIIFASEGAGCDGSLLGTVKDTSNETVSVYLILEDADSSKIAADDMYTFYAVQETLNDVLDSLKNIPSFTAA